MLMLKQHHQVLRWETQQAEIGGEKPSQCTEQRLLIERVVKKKCSSNFRREVYVRLRVRDETKRDFKKFEVRLEGNRKDTS